MSNFLRKLFSNKQIATTEEKSEDITIRNTLEKKVVNIGEYRFKKLNRIESYEEKITYICNLNDESLKELFTKANDKRMLAFVDQSYYSSIRAMLESARDDSNQTYDILNENVQKWYKIALSL